MPVPCSSGHSGTHHYFFEGRQTMDDSSRFDCAHMMRMGDFVLVVLQGTFCRSCRLPRGVITFEQPLQCQNLRRYARSLILRHPRRFQNRWTQTVEKPLGNVQTILPLPAFTRFAPVFVLILYLRQMFIQRSRTQKNAPHRYPTVKYVSVILATNPYAARKLLN